jgi:AraC family transcriptional regulator
MIRVATPTMGNKTSELAFSGVVFTEATFSPDSSLPWHTHDQPTICLVLDGSLVEGFRSAEHELGKYDLTFKPAAVEHRDRYGAGGARCLIIELRQPWIDAHDVGPLLADQPVHAGTNGSLRLASRLHEEFASRAPASGIALEGICLELIALFSRLGTQREPRNTPGWLRRARDLVRERCSERVHLADIAQVVDVHPVHLAQAFKRRFGETIGDYTRQLRVRRAAESLSASDQSIAEIALACGFYDQSHFTRTFKLHTTMTPGQYRARHGSPIACHSEP